MKIIPMLLPCLLAVSTLCSAQYTDHFRNGDPIPDFSRVGYHWGDDEIPDVPVVSTIRPPKKGEDATALIQSAIDNAPTPGAILLKAGTYRVGGVINLNRSSLVLRGEGGKTVVVAAGKGQRSLVTMGSPDTKPQYGRKVPIVEDVPLAQMWVRVADPGQFRPTDRVAVRREGTEKWIHDLRMDRIEGRPGRELKQWTPKEYTIDWERTVLDVRGDTLFLDNPIVMEITEEYGGGAVMKLSRKRIRESGIEDIAFVSEYDPAVVDPAKGYCCDEDHGWSAVAVGNAEHCWVRRVTSRHFGYALASIHKGAKNITVADCHSFEPVSIITGSRRYAFNVAGQLCLVRDCTCSEDRHQFVTHARAAGPNVFLRCSAIKSFSDCGPHHRWATGMLYDCVVVDGKFDVEDRGDLGTGHGWTGANFVIWNCEAGKFRIQSPWVSAKNYAIGCVGPRDTGPGRYSEPRPQGVWESYDSHVTPESLYEYQLERRRKAGIKISK